MSNTWLCDGCGKEFDKEDEATKHEIRCPEFKAKKEKEEAEEVANLNILRIMSKEEITEAVVKQKEIVTQKENDVKVRAKILRIADELGKEGRKEQKTSQKELTIESNILKTERARLTVVQDISSEIFIASEEAAKFKAQRDKEAAKLKAQRDKEAKQAALLKAYTDKQKAELKVHSYSWMDSAQRFPYHTLYISLIQIIAFLVLIVFIIFGFIPLTVCLNVFALNKVMPSKIK